MDNTLLWEAARSDQPIAADQEASDKFQKQAQQR
jgi:hypothetical protein